jgi:CheY-like chemotaxis protein
VPVVLVVDDGEANRQLMEAYLVDIDCRVRTAEDGRLIPSQGAGPRWDPELVALFVGEISTIRQLGAA